jgi:hypothetical protein
MIGSLRLFAIEARRSTAIWFVPVALAITWYIGRQSHANEVTLWSKTSAQAGQALIVLGPLISGLAAWIASRDRRRGIEDLLETTPKSQACRHLLGFWSTVGWGLLAYVAAVSAVFAMTYRAATWGSPDLLPVAIAMATITLAAAVGYAAGLCLPSRFTPALVPIAVILALIAPTGGAERRIDDAQGIFVAYESPVRNFSPLTFVEPEDYDPFYNTWPDIALPLIVWLIAITGMALAAIVLRSRRTPLGWGVLLISVLAASIAGAGLYRTDSQGILEASSIETELVCQGDGITVCMHPAYEAVLDDVADLVHDLIEPVAGLPGVPTRVEQVHFRTEDPPVGVLRMHFYNWIYGTPFPRSDDAEILVRQLLCEAACEDVFSTGYRFGDPAREVVGVWLLMQSGVEPNPFPPILPGIIEAQERVEEAVRRFDALGPDERRAWFERHFADLRAGRLTMDDLP